MLLIASETLRHNPSLTDVSREMSLTVSYFASVTTFNELLDGRSRRIALLAEGDISAETLRSLQGARERAEFGIVVAASRAALRSSNRADVVDRFAEFENVEWIGQDFNFDQLSAAARRCRRRMLKISRSEVEAALENGEFVLRYQPKVARDNGREWETREAEALVRWHHPQNGLMGPLEFLPEIEAFGLMKELSELVLFETASQLIKWRERGMRLNACINLASSQLNDAELADTYAAIVRQSGLECESFTFEVVEQDLTDPEAPHVQMLSALREQGFRICLDDFRVAASSLSTFEKLPFDEIKIHASALRKAQRDTVAMTVLAAVTGLAHNLGMSVCAEGVEDEATYEFLKTIECDKMQGFLISEAVMPSIIQRAYSSAGETANSAA